MKQLLAILVVMVLAAGSILAQSNESLVNQDGVNTATVDQLGSTNYSNVGQTTPSIAGPKNVADVDQSGTKLSSYIEQVGKNNTATVDQSGVGAGKLVPAQWYVHPIDLVGWAPNTNTFWGAAIDQKGEDNMHSIKQSGGNANAAQNSANIYVEGSGNHTGPFTPINFAPFSTPYSIEQTGVANWAWMNLIGNNNNTAIKQQGVSNQGEIWMRGNDNEAVMVQDGSSSWNWALFTVNYNNAGPVSDRNRQYTEQHGNQHIMETDVWGSDNISCVSQFGFNNYDWTQIYGNANYMTLKQEGSQNVNNKYGNWNNAQPYSTIRGNLNRMTIDQGGLNGGAGNYNWVWFWIEGNRNNAGQTMLTVDQRGNSNKSWDNVFGDDNQFWSKQVGNSNKAYLDVHATSDFNISEITQLGNDNLADVDQTGDGNRSYIVSNGSTNTALVGQTGGLNLSTVNQLGTGNTATVTQGPLVP